LTIHSTQDLLDLTRRTEVGPRQVVGITVKEQKKGAIFRLRALFLGAEKGI
jgi:hypothetical protein